MTVSKWSRPKRLETILEAQLALSLDPDGEVFVSAKEVFVSTKKGCGTFDRKKWEENSANREKYP